MWNRLRVEEALHKSLHAELRQHASRFQQCRLAAHNQTHVELEHVSQEQAKGLLEQEQVSAPAAQRPPRSSHSLCAPPIGAGAAGEAARGVLPRQPRRGPRGARQVGVHTIHMHTYACTHTYWRASSYSAHRSACGFCAHRSQSGSTCSAAMSKQPHELSSPSPCDLSNSTGG